MSYRIEDHEIDLAKIEDEARQLRAEAIRYGASQIKRWVVGLFAKPATSQEASQEASQAA